MPRRPSSNVNLAAIAKQLGISISTASRALRNADGIRDETRTQVLEAAEALGYKFSRRNTVEADTQPHHIMALAQCCSPHKDQRYLTGMSRASVMMNLAILSHHVSAEESASVVDPKYQPAAMKAGLVEGLVLIHRWPMEIAAELSEKWPAVSIIHHYPNTAIDYIGIDDHTGYANVIKKLFEGGHTRIGFFGLCPDISWSCARFAAYVENLVKMGLPFEPQNAIQIRLAEALDPLTFERGDWSETVISRVNAGVDAWVCASEATGYALCRCIRDHGFRIPEEVAVTGYHANIAQPVDLPRLSSTQVADEELGAARVAAIALPVQSSGGIAEVHPPARPLLRG